jgi:predicted nuclease of predicted toxin-antitoxin system
MPEMKLLFDQNISFRILQYLPEIFLDSQQVRTIGLENAADLKIWEYARKNGFTIITFDADFYDISLLKGHPPKIVWIRTGNITTTEIAECIFINRFNISDFIGDPERGCLEISKPVQ